MSYPAGVLQAGITAANYKFFDTHNNNSAFLLEQLVSLIKESSIPFSDNTAELCGLFLGTTYSNLKIRNDSFKKYSERGLRVMNPADAPQGLISYLGGQLSIMLNIRGMQSSLSSVCSQGFDAFTQGFYFLKRNPRHRAIVIEYMEELVGDFQTAMSGCSIITLENSLPDAETKSYGSVRAISSYFESKGENKGLSRAIQAALDSCRLSLCDISCIFSGSSSGPKRHLEQEAIYRCGGSERVEQILPEDNSIPSSSGLLPLVFFLEEQRYPEASGKSGCIAMFLNLGDDTNSSCLIVERS